MNFIKDKKYTKIAIIISIPILLIAQYYLFNFGLIRPILKGVEIKIADGDYIGDLDKYVVKLDDKVKLSMGDYIMIPKYSKEPSLTFKVLDSNEIVSIEGNNMTTLKEGYASIGVMNGSSLLKKATIKVVNPKVENLELDIEENLIYVGDISKINSLVEVDYKGFKQPSKVKYESSNKNVIKIEEDDTIKAVGVGTATIYAKSGDKVDEATFNIRAKVASIDIDSTIEISEKEEFKLNPNIITSPKNLKHPKIEYSLVGVKLSVSRAIGIDDNGTIVGLREGEEIVKITCGNKSKRITVKVVKESITDKNIKNLEVNKEIIDDEMIITATWDHLDGVDNYEMYVRNNSLKEEGFRQVKDIIIEEYEFEHKIKRKATMKIDITNMDEIDMDIYVIGKSKDGMTKPSNIVKIEYKKELDSIKNISGYFDKENSSVKLTWDSIEKENVTYGIYIKDKLNNEEEFNVYAQGITSNAFSIDVSGGEVDLEVYVVATYGNKSIQSQIIIIK